ncbi:MAG: aldehyde dehydrogenase [Rhodobacteraceae bacterium]|nr:aldehyde dehydrogenase [Paracoccaceae bacterium]
MEPLALLIGGKNIEASNGKTFDRRNPMTREVATIAAAASTEDAIRAADAAAAAAFPAWSETGPAERRANLNAAADALEARRGDLIKAMAEETGATVAWAGFNIMLAAGMLREAAALTTMIKGDIIPSNRPGSLAMGIRQPAGVVLAIAPWNAPIVLGVRAVATPLACGNTVILKTSEICPRTHRLIVDAFQDAGFPNGVINAVSNAPEDAADIVRTMIEHPAVRRVNFTGSTRVGKVIGEVAARNLKPALLELGGKAPMIILEDADIDAAVAAAGFGAFMNQGQICMSTERLIVHEDIADAFVTKMTEKVKSLKVGDPREGKTPLGCVIDHGAAERIESLVRDAVDKGATLTAGGGRSGTLVDATLLDHVTPSMRIYKEETFGPIASIVRISSEDEAVRIANDTEYGLAASVFSKDVSRALRIAKRIESGICHVNGPTVHDEAQMPFGGTKESGYGRFGGMAGVEEFTELRWITIQDGAPHYTI